MILSQKPKPASEAFSSEHGAGIALTAEAASLSKYSPDEKAEGKGVAPVVSEQNPAKRLRVAPSLAGIPPDQIARHLPSDEEMKHAFGLKTDSAAQALLLASLVGLGNQGELFRSLVLAMGAEMEPTDAIEAMLLQQMAVTHISMIMASSMALDGKTLEAIEAHDRIRNRLARTFTTQIEALRRYRSGAEQGLRVGQVNVHEGGQAIVGNVSNGRAKGAK